MKTTQSEFKKSKHESVRLSIVVPAFNEEGSLEKLYLELAKVIGRGILLFTFGAGIERGNAYNHCTIKINAYAESGCHETLGINTHFWPDCQTPPATQLLQWMQIYNILQKWSFD